MNAQLQATPTGWTQAKLSSLVSNTQLGGDYPSSVAGTGIPLVKMINIGRGGIINLDKLEKVDESIAIASRNYLKPQDLLLNTRNSLDLVGKVALWRGEEAVAAFNNNLMRIELKPEKGLVNEFANLWFNSHNGIRQLRRIAIGTTSVAAIYWRDLASLKLLFPSQSEQRKISDILSTWDEALEKLDALIEAQDRRKKALMQQLLTGRKRVSGFKGKWKKVALGEVAENKSEQNKGRMGTASLYGVTKADGVVPMRDHVKGESFDRCKRLEPNWFAYNPMRINIGSIARWQGKETVMVSGDYVVFRCHENRLLPNYLDHLRRSWIWHSFVTRGGNGSVRIRIYFSDLGEFTFPCPSIEEQQKIAAILDTAQAELTLLRAQRTALDQQKRGLMQRLLTGRLRVAPNVS